MFEKFKKKKLNKEISTELAKIMVEAQAGLMKHFAGFVEQQNLKKEFQAYCKKNPVIVKMPNIDKINNIKIVQLRDEEGEIISEVSEKDLITKDEKPDLRYMG